MMVYKKIFKWNNSHNPKAEYQLTELELPSGTHRPLRSNAQHSADKGFLTDLYYSFNQFWSLFLQLFLPPYLHTTLILLILWFTCAFGFYGLSVWFPEYIKLLQTEEYEARATIVKEPVYEKIFFNNTRIDNYHYIEGIFNSVRFDNVVLNHVIFEKCSIYDSTFSDVRSSRTFFRDSYVANNLFLDTDFYKYRFENCEMVNNTFRALVPGCELDFDYNIHYKDVFQENLIGQLTMVPGTIVASMLMDKIGRARIMCVSMLVSGLSAFFIWFLNTKTSVIIFEAIFNFIFIAGWNALDITTTEAFPTRIRTTAYGFLSATSRIAGILGSLCFGNFIYASRTIPMLTTSAVLLFGGIVATRMTETRDALM